MVLKTLQANLIEKIVIFTGNRYPINKYGIHFYITLTIQLVVLAPVSQLGFFFTINAQRILNVWEVIFYASKTHNLQLRGGSGKFGGQKKSRPL